MTTTQSAGDFCLDATPEECERFRRRLNDTVEEVVLPAASPQQEEDPLVELFDGWLVQMDEDDLRGLEAKVGGALHDISVSIKELKDQLEALNQRLEAGRAYKARIVSARQAGRHRS